MTSPAQNLAVVHSAFNTRARRWYKVGTYSNTDSAKTIRYMVENGKGLKAFEGYPPRTFEARIAQDGVTVQFRKMAD